MWKFSGGEPRLLNVGPAQRRIGVVRHLKAPPDRKTVAVPAHGVSLGTFMWLKQFEFNSLMDNALSFLINCARPLYGKSEDPARLYNEPIVLSRIRVEEPLPATAQVSADSGRHWTGNWSVCGSGRVF